MEAATAEYGGGAFDVPPGGTFIKIDRYSGERLTGDAEGEWVVAEYFREGEEPLFGITFDGGFAMSSDLRLFGEKEVVKEVTTSSGKKVKVAPKASFGSLSSGGLY